MNKQDDVVSARILFKCMDPSALYIVKNENGEVWWTSMPSHLTYNRYRWELPSFMSGYLGKIKVKEFEGKKWTECIIRREPSYEEWVGHLCYFWDDEIYSPLNDNTGKPFIDILSNVEFSGDNINFSGRAIGYYKHCLPVKESDVKFYNGEVVEYVGKN